MKKLVTRTLPSDPITAVRRRKLEELSTRPDSEIDFSDIPELEESFWKNAIHNPFYRPVKQQLTVRLETQGTSSAQWMLMGFAPGVLAAPGPSRFDPDRVSAAYAQLAGAEVWQFKPAQAGQVTLTFELRRPRGREGSIRTVTYAITVR